MTPDVAAKVTSQNSQRAELQGSADVKLVTKNIEDIIKQLKARGRREQMLMFLTGPAGSGKGTAVMVSLL